MVDLFYSAISVHSIWVLIWVLIVCFNHCVHNQALEYVSSCAWLRVIVCVNDGDHQSMCVIA